MFKEKPVTLGHKAAKDRIMVLGGNTNRDYELWPVIYCAEKHRLLRGGSSNFPILWAVEKGWMSGPLFTQWFSDQMYCELKHNSQKYGLKHVALLDG